MLGCREPPKEGRRGTFCTFGGKAELLGEYDAEVVGASVCPAVGWLAAEEGRDCASDAVCEFADTGRRGIR
jgi:hypothetical protein